MGGSTIGGLVGIVLSVVALGGVLTRPRAGVREELRGLRFGTALVIVFNAYLAAIAVLIDVTLGLTSSLLAGLAGGVAIGVASGAVAARWLDIAGRPTTADTAGRARAGVTMLGAIVLALAGAVLLLLGTFLAG
jgi:hypothetical protein